MIYGQGDGDATSTWGSVVFRSATPAKFDFVNVTVDDLHGGGYLIEGNYDSPYRDVSSQVTFRNCVFSSLDAAIFVNGPSTLIADHNVFYCPNRPQQIIDHESVSYSSITLSNLGPCNLYADPLFVSRAWGISGNYHLSTNSPAINLGTTFGAPTEDLDRNTRGDEPDAGSYECINCGVPRLSGLEVRTNGFSFRVTTLPGREYEIHRAWALGAAWDRIYTFLGTGGEVFFTDPTALSSTAFYRARLVECR